MDVPPQAIDSIAASIKQHFADYFLPGDLVLPDEELDYCARKFATDAAPHIAEVAWKEGYLARMRHAAMETMDPESLNHFDGLKANPYRTDEA